MFQFTTTTIVNDPAIVMTSEKPSGSKLAADEVIIKRGPKFKKANILSITHAASEPEKKAKIVLDPGTVQDNKIYRLALYIGLQDSMSSYYSNDFVYRGKPLFIEVKSGTGANKGTVVDAIITNAKKYQNMVYENELVTFKKNGSAGSAKLEIYATDCHQVFKKVEFQEWVDATGDNAIPGTGEWKVNVAMDLSKDNASTVIFGNPGFGTYSHLMHNYILPTGANLRYEHILQDETPKVSGVYDQYIVRMCVNRGIMGGDAVGETTKSVTTHVFWVDKDAKSDFNTAMLKLGAITEVDKDVKDKDPELPLEKPMDALEKRIAALEAKNV